MLGSAPDNDPDLIDACRLLDGDPFGLVSHDPGTLKVLVRLDTEASLHPLAPVRFVARLPDGRIILAEQAGGGDAVQIGAAVTMADAGELATAVAAGSSRARTAPLVVHTLMLGFLAALAMDAEQRLRPVVVS